MATQTEIQAIRAVVMAWADVDFTLEIPSTWGSFQTHAFYKAVENLERSLLNLQYAAGILEPRHQTDCICADCSGAELTADND